MDHPFNYLWQLVLSLGALLLGWLHYSRREEVKEMKAAIAAAHATAQEACEAAEEAKHSATTLAFQAGAALYEHKLFAAETFARKDDIDKAEKRLSDQLNKHGEAQLDRLEEIRDRLPRRN